MSNTITKIEKTSPLARRCHVGEKLISINGHEIQDVLDYKFFSYDSRLKVELESLRGNRRTVSIKKSPGADLGLEFETYLMDRARACRNKCVFCFVDQLPRGMRKTLYFKDDDARLSFLTGNYITLTNLSERELQRIIDLRISPINISVHATDPELRAKLLGNANAARGFELMKRLAAGGITMNCQIVCCPGLNDGQALTNTMEDLTTLYPQAASVSVVPVGLTRFRQGLYPLEPFTPAHAAETIDQIEDFGENCLKNFGSRIFFPSDELYLKAGRPIPENEFYEDYPQLENGVGMLRLLETEFVSALETEPLSPDGRPFSVATGVSAAPFINKLLVTANKQYDIINGKVYAVQNDFFGHTIDVAGLITGGDLINQLRDKPLGERLLIPINMLRDGETVFLDDVSLKDLENALGVPVEVVAQDGRDLLLAFAGVKQGQ